MVFEAEAFKKLEVPYRLRLPLFLLLFFYRFLFEFGELLANLFLTSLPQNDVVLTDFTFSDDLLVVVRDVGEDFRIEYIFIDKIFLMIRKHDFNIF